MEVVKIMDEIRVWFVITTISESLPFYEITIRLGIILFVQY